MLLAYIDEIGQPGAFVDLNHPRYSDSPAFGYGGFIISEKYAREFAACFEHNKRTLFASEIPKDIDPGRWEKKGANLLYAKVNEERPQNLRVLCKLVHKLVKDFRGQLFYYAEEKPLGTPKETNCRKEEYSLREEICMRETLNRLARFADQQSEQILVLMDQINEKSRQQRLPIMYSHILGRATKHEDMRRIIEPPMHVDSKLSANIQFADWICALVKRAIEYQLVEHSRYEWLTKVNDLNKVRGNFTHESKLHLYEHPIDDLHHSEILRTRRAVIDPILERRRLDAANSAKLQQIWKATYQANLKSTNK